VVDNLLNYVLPFTTMETVDYDFDPQLTNFITDFSDGNLDGIELNVFNEYMQTCNPVQNFALKARNGRRSLQAHYKVEASEDFEAKLARRIAAEEKKMMRDLDTVT